MSTKEEGRAFPWRCPECGKKDVNPVCVDYTAEVRHDGKLYSVQVPNMTVPKCGACGEMVFDSAASDQIAHALRMQLGFLQPEEIRQRRKRLGLKQAELASRIGTAAETISRWETDTSIQTAAMDRLLRFFFDSPDARRLATANQPTLLQGFVSAVSEEYQWITAALEISTCGVTVSEEQGRPLEDEMAWAA